MPRPVLLVHLASELGSVERAIAAKLEGEVVSVAVRASEGAHLDALAAEVEVELARHDLRDVVLLASGAAGPFALSWATHHPERVAGLVVLDTLAWPRPRLAVGRALWRGRRDPRARRRGLADLHPEVRRWLAALERGLEALREKPAEIVLSSEARAAEREVARWLLHLPTASVRRVPGADEAVAEAALGALRRLRR